MGKRHSSADGEEEYEENAASKRPRIDEEDDDNDDEEEEEEEEEEDNLNTERMRRTIVESSSRKGRIAEYGIIESMEMIQFMCHPRLSFRFGPQINFIIGHNGSGKSAVLTAITVGLGGKAATTGRGSGLKSFIQEGKTWAEVTITLKNEGSEAFKPDTYGSGIIITRRFTITGTSSYRIRGKKDARVISDKKEELSAILDHMGIQVDNPLNVLTQDAARQFLGGASSSQKYEFFLKGTQLKQLSEEYEIILSNVSRLYKLIKNREVALPDHKKAFEDAKSRYQGAKRAIETRGKIMSLRHEQAWSYVKEKEDELTKQIEEVAIRTRKIPKIQESLNEAKAVYDSTTQVIVDLESENGKLGNIDQLTTEKHQLEEHIRAIRTRLQDYSNQEKTISSDLKRLKRTITEYENQIAEENAKLQIDKQASREELRANLEQVKSKMGTRQEELKNANAQIQDVKERQSALMRRRNEADVALRNYKETEAQCQKQCEHLNNLANNRVAAFGQNMPKLRNLIESARWYGEKPIGPLGLFVSLPDKTWAPILRIVLGFLMNSFAITDARDREQLKRFLVDTQNSKTQIIVTERDEFDYSNGEPPENVKTVLRILKFSDEFVKRMFINHSRIERTLIARTRLEAEREVERIRGGTALSLDLYRVTVYPDGGGYSSVPLEGLKIEDPRQRHFLHDNIREELSQWVERGRQASSDFRLKQEELQTIQKQLGELSKQLQTWNNVAKSANDEIFALKQTQRSLEDQQGDDISPGLASLEAGLREANEGKDNTLQQYKELAANKAASEQELSSRKAEYEQVQDQIRDFDEQKNDLIEKISEEAAKRAGAQKRVDHWETKLQEAQSTIQRLEAEEKTLNEEYKQWTKKAEDLCGGIRVDNPRRMADIKREIKSVESALERQEREVGATIDELEDELRRAKNVYENTQKDIKEMQMLNKSLKASVVLRLNRWHNFRRHIAIRTKLMFQHHLSKRSFCGKVIFNHEKQKLDLKIQTEEQAFTQGLTKEVKALSGGEKSYSTICLLLALWEAIGCPIRCLDEFDVFMDAVNRRVAMKLLIETANSSEGKQFILITPQDMSNVPIGPTTRVHRMGDPERGQTTL